MSKKLQIGSDQKIDYLLHELLHTWAVLTAYTNIAIAVPTCVSQSTSDLSLSLGFLKSLIFWFKLNAGLISNKVDSIYFCVTVYFKKKIIKISQFFLLPDLILKLIILLILIYLF